MMKTMFKNPTQNIFLFIFIYVGLVLGSESVIEKIDQIVQAESKYDLFSGTVLVAKDGKILYAEGIGHANKEYNIPNILETRYNTGSIQKTFIATLIMQLYQEKKISLSDPLNKFYADCPFKTAGQIQIKHLLNHTSGLGNYREHPEYSAKAESFKTISDVLYLVYEQNPEFEPGEKFNYSNTGMLLLKGIIEKVTEMPLDQAIQTRIWKPLGMNSSAFFHGGELLPHRATGHALSDKTLTYGRATGEPSPYAGGGIYTTVLDLLKFDQALYGETLLNEENKRIMFTPVEPSRFYGYGWIVVPFGGTTVIYHGGASGGFSAEFRRYPEKGYTIIVLSNYEGAAFELCNKIDCMLLGEPYTVTTEYEFHSRRGRQYRHMGLLDAAFQSYSKILESSVWDEISPEILKQAESGINMVGYGFFKNENYSRALEIMKLNVTHFPQSYNAYDSLAEIFMKTGDRGRAIENYRKALKLNPNKTEAEKRIYKGSEENLKKLLAEK